MKRFNLLCALFLAVLLSLCWTCASAVVDTAAVPSMTFSMLQQSGNAGSSVTLVVTPTLPGFLSLRLTDSEGTEVTRFYNSYELHTGDNNVPVRLLDGEGNPLPEGNYTISGVMVTQFGVSSSAATAPLTILPPSTVPDAADNPADEGDDTGNTSVEPLPEADASTLPAATLPTAEQTLDSTLPAAPAEPPAVVTYSAGSGEVGEEGLMIGVGVGDIAQQPDAGYWGLTASSDDAQIWEALIKDMVSVNVDEREAAYIYDSVGEGQKRLGTVSGLSQGLNVVFERSDGWSLVEAYRNEDGAFMRGYIRSNRLRTVSVNQNYGIVVDKATQTLSVYKDGQRVGSCRVTTGLPTPEYLQRETPAGEFMTVTRRGTTEYAGKGYSLYTIRINGNYHLCELPTTKRNGSDFSLLEGALGTKATRGNITIQHEASADGGINAKWIWDMTDSNKKVKVLIFDDKNRSQVPAGL